ncbi:MAG: arginine--tRNA ligase [Promethearchaeota archaeon]
MNIIDHLAQILNEILANPELNVEQLKRFIKPAKKNVDADFALNCFALKKALKIDGLQIANELGSKLQTIIKNSKDLASQNKFIFLQSVEVTGPYLNFKMNKAMVAREIIFKIHENIQQYSISEYTSQNHQKRIVVEFPSPNTNKPLHLGHIRNMLLGQSLSLLNKKVGNSVFQTNLLNDRGIHICKSMLAYKKYGNNQTPESEHMKSDHFVGKFYVKFAQEEAKLKTGLEQKIASMEEEKKKFDGERDDSLIKSLETELNQTKWGKMQKELKGMLMRWEENDPEVRALWRKMNDWAEAGFKETFAKFGIHHDTTYLESQIFDKGKNIVIDGLKKGIFSQLEDGAVVATFNKKGLPKQKVLLRKDGTTLYSTQDIYLAFQKMKDFQYDQSIYVVGNEQNMQLKTIFEILRILGMKADNFHYSYGMINLTSGKMKSREGTVVDADDIVQELKELALIEVKNRYTDLSKDQMNFRAERISMAALRFFILKYEYSRDFLFDPVKSISFEGETGPYILYSYARICSIFKKAQTDFDLQVPFDIQNDKENESYYQNYQDFKFELLNDPTEQMLIDRLYHYPHIISDSVISLKPHILTRFLLELAQDFSKFYHNCPVLRENNTDLRQARLILSNAVRSVLKDGLKSLNIDVLNEM